jgi:hypothetical protein
MADLQVLVEGINRWRVSNITDYWVHVSYMGGELHRFGDHNLTFTESKLWHLRGGEWRVVEKGSDFWLFSVPGAFAWARDTLTKILPGIDANPDMCTVRCHPEYGYVELLQVEVGHRAEANFTFQVTRFGVGEHPDFNAE